MMIRIERTTPEDLGFQQVAEQLTRLLTEINGKDDAFFQNLNRSDTIPYALVAYDEDQPVGCGALRPYDTEHIEIKRMFVDSNARLQGVGSLLLQELELWARELGYRYTRLETSDMLEQAISLYQKFNYQIIPNYGSYECEAHSLCFEKDLLP